MGSIVLIVPTTTSTTTLHGHLLICHRNTMMGGTPTTHKSRVKSCLAPNPIGHRGGFGSNHQRRSVCQSKSNPLSYAEEEEESVEDLRVPNHWLNPSKALEESEWLRVTLHKWLDDEYCPEPTNVEISKVASLSYYKSLVQNQTDSGEILLKMARELESISYQESFHGAFSSANAAINLIIQRIEQDWP